MSQMMVFVSHAHEDEAFCRELVDALRKAEADVWYDEHNLHPGVLRNEIMRELANRPVFVVVLSKAAFASEWVRDECEWAYNLFKRKPDRLLLPVVAAPYDQDDFDLILYLESLKRVEGAGHQPYPLHQAIARTIQLLQLPTPHDALLDTAPEPTESADDLVDQSRALAAQGRHADALPLLERAAHLAPRNLDTWLNLGSALYMLRHDYEALDAYDQALALDPRNAVAWTNKGAVLGRLARHKEALAACDRALILDPNSPLAWRNKSLVLGYLNRHEEALAACDRALALDPSSAAVWGAKGFVLDNLGRYKEALAACSQAVALDPSSAAAWRAKGFVLRRVGQTIEAEAAERRAEELGG